MATLYERIGGEKGIDAIITKLQEIMLSNPVTAPFFAKTDMAVQARREKQFVAMVTGGPKEYEGKDMKAAHADIKISQKEFDVTWDNFKEALEFCKVGEKEISELKAIVYSAQGDVVTC